MCSDTRMTPRFWLRIPKKSYLSFWRQRGRVYPGSRGPFSKYPIWNKPCLRFDKAPETLFFLSTLRASLKQPAASPRTISIDKKKISSGTQGRQSGERIGLVIRLFGFKMCFDYKRDLFLVILSSISPRSCSCKWPTGCILPVGTIDPVTSHLNYSLWIICMSGVPCKGMDSIFWIPYPKIHDSFFVGRNESLFLLLPAGRVEVGG